MPSMGLPSKLLRQHRRLLSLRLPPLLSSASPLQNPSRTFHLLRSAPSLIALHHAPFSLSRSLSWFSWNQSSDNGGSNSSSGDGGGTEILHDGPFLSTDSGSEFSSVDSSPTGTEMSSIGFDESGMVEETICESVCYYPVRVLISMLDGYQEFSSFPWWVIVSTSTMALRLSLLPVLILQLRKGQKMALLLPKLPPPFPPPLSGRSLREQYILFRQKRKELGCPSYMWNFAFFTVQAPCFLLWMTSIRRMCLDNHPGFDTGGFLWFSNLTDFPSGILGCVFPILISGLHYVNVQISFQNITSAKLQGILGVLTKYYKLYLDILAVPLLFIAFHVPQGSLVYWLTNSMLTLSQQLFLRNPFIRTKLGLQNDQGRTKHVASDNVLPENNDNLKVEVPVETLSPLMLLDHALEIMAAGDNSKAIPLLEMAIEKDPEMVRASVAMGQICISRGSLVEATKYYEDAISKIHNEDDTLLVLATFGAGVSHLLQGNKLEAIRHLKRIAELKEPESLMDKACYHKGLVILGSALFEQGEKSEAAKYLRIAATYDPGVNAYLKECEEG